MRHLSREIDESVSLTLSKPVPCNLGFLTNIVSYGILGPLHRQATYIESMLVVVGGGVFCSTTKISFVCVYTLHRCFEYGNFHSRTCRLFSPALSNHIVD